ncbi:MAG: hypothetical protein A3F67_09165 [Verrucomicrobia bacterium RIFCSPHIGHO2_12_FULL_41_10]|nr:MAG: hypothetical protein A3F67_09165 [Verrucomicrobia bacterium RIFCSPHIGHO2_12_FULL_41_10]HLB34572.1 SH3 domain-containing protein [Chthoniobacterales bacterium]
MSILSLKSFILTFCLVLLIITERSLVAGSPLDTLFPLENYDQTIAAWISPTDAYYDQELLSDTIKEYRKEELYQHFFGALSPWDAAHIAAVLKGNIKQEEEVLLRTHSNPNNPYYREDINHAVPYPFDWLKEIKENINLSQFDSLIYDSSKRGITVTNLAARVLPTTQPAFLNPTLPGEGYPFDYLQMSALWVGTPIYILGTTQDGAWDLVLTPDYIAWVKSDGIAVANQEFINTWSEAAKHQLIAITKTGATLLDSQGEPLQAYVGSFFPRATSSHLENSLDIMLPVTDENHHASIKISSVAPDQSAPIPLSLTPHHMADIISTMIGRPYGWGGVEFYNDCSAELKSLFTPFGIYLPRHSSDQITIGKMIDRSSLLPRERLSYLMDQGKPFLSLIYIGGHVILYIGSYSNPYDSNSFMAMTYQNLWGLRPNASYPDRRSIIGQSAFFPLLLEYPEDSTLVSLANKQVFKVCDLSQLPSSDSSNFNINGSLINLMIGNPWIQPGKTNSSVNLKSLMYPEHIYRN